MRLLISVRDDAVPIMKAGFAPRFMKALQLHLERYSAILQGVVKGKLSDDVLHVRTGTLRRSINREVKTGVGSVEAIVGTNVVYAAIHEYGFDGQVAVHSYVRRISKAGSQSLASGRAVYHETGQVADGYALVHGFTRKVHLPERSFLRSSLRETEHVARDEIAAAVKEAVS